MGPEEMFRLGTEDFLREAQSSQEYMKDELLRRYGLA